MKLFRRPISRGSLGDRLDSLIIETKTAAESADAAAISRARELAWRFQSDLMCEIAGGRPLPAGGALFDVARITLRMETGAESWTRAVKCGVALAAATAILDAEVYRRGEGLPEGLIQRLYQLADLAAYSAHRAGTPIAATLVVEGLTSLILSSRMLHRSLTAVIGQQSSEALNERLRRLRQTQQDFAEQLTVEVAPNATDADSLSEYLRQDFERQLARLLEAERGGVDVYPLLGPSTFASYAQRLTGRTILYVTAGLQGGCAILLSPDVPGRADSVELPELKLDSMCAALEEVREEFRKARRVPPRRKWMGSLLQALLDRVGEWVWAPVVEAWPDLLASPLAVVPVGEASGLPLFTATVNGGPVCASADIAILPSVQAMVLAALLPKRADGGVLVAADEWFGEGAIPRATTEARAVAAVYGTKPLLMRERQPKETAEQASLEEVQLRSNVSGSDSKPDVPVSASEVSHHDLITRISQSSVVHFACHGDYKAAAPLDTALLLGQALRLGDLLEKDLHFAPLVVLSACELAEVGRSSPSEQLGFPQTLLSMGASGVVGALWPVPDHEDTVNLMESLHQSLRTTSPAKALGSIIGAAYSSRVPTSVWGSFAYYGP